MFFRFLKKVIDKFFVFWACSVRNFLLRSPFPSTLVYSKRSRGDLFKTAVVEFIGVGSSALGAERVLYQFFVLAFWEKHSLEVFFCFFLKKVGFWVVVGLGRGQRVAQVVRSVDREVHSVHSESKELRHWVCQRVTSLRVVGRLQEGLDRLGQERSAAAVSTGE